MNGLPSLVVFDLDGTLTESKQPLTSEMAARLLTLLSRTKVAVISGGALPQFLTQVVMQLPPDTHLANLYLLPTSGAALYEWEGGDWKKIYEERLSETQAHVIEQAVNEAVAASGIVDLSSPSYGPRVEYRGGQVSFSALGQKAPLELKKEWDPDHAKRRVLQAAIAAKLPDFSAAMGGATTIDVTKKDVDKAYGVRQLCKRLGIGEREALYVGDELSAGGNDEAVYKTDVPTRSVENPSETIKVFRELLAE